MLSIREERLQIFVVLNASFNTKYSITHNFKKRKPKLFHLFLNISTPLLQFQLFQCRQCKPDVFEHSIQIFLRDIQQFALIQIQLLHGCDSLLFNEFMDQHEQSHQLLEHLFRGTSIGSANELPQISVGKNHIVETPLFQIFLKSLKAVDRVVGIFFINGEASL